MNEGMFIALRNYAEEHSSLLRQLLEAQNKTNEMLSQLVAKPEPIGFAKVTPSGDIQATKATPKKGK